MAAKSTCRIEIVRDKGNACFRWRKRRERQVHKHTTVEK
jgi:hypothetical protein